MPQESVNFRTLDLNLLRVFDLEWRLDEISQYADWFERPHGDGDDDSGAQDADPLLVPGLRQSFEALLLGTGPESVGTAMVRVAKRAVAAASSVTCKVPMWTSVRPLPLAARSAGSAWRGRAGRVVRPPGRRRGRGLPMCGTRPACWRRCGWPTW